MRQFILLIRRYWNIILFLILEVTCFSMISKSRNMQGNDIIASSNSVVGYAYKKQNDVVYYFQLKRLNDSLMNENARLRNVLASNDNIDSFKDAIASIPVTVKDTITTSTKDSSGTIKITSTGVTKVVRYANYYYIPARVINNSVASGKQNTITINRGSEDGVGVGMGVVTGNGIVGRVEHVSAHYASVVSVLSNRRVSAKLSDGTSDLFVDWIHGSPDFVYSENVPSYSKVKRGDSIFSTGYNRVYPENILIGFVTKIDTIKATNTKTLKIRLSTNFRKLQYVYVVNNKLSEEWNKIEAVKKDSVRTSKK